MARQVFLWAIILTALAGCAARPGPELLAPVSPPPLSSRQVLIHVATNREPDAKHPGNFDTARSARLAFARYNISIPPNHKPTAIEWATSRRVDPATSFATLEYAPLSPEAFARHPAEADNGTDGADSGDRVIVFVHGYNTNYSESVLRMAQLMADNPFPGRAILFAWPSDGRLSGYVADKDAATYSRDHLAQLLELLADNPRYREISLAAHSMGCWLAMESLRQLRLTGRAAVLQRLDNVLLAAPDIDLDVFRAQAEAVGPLDPPLTVLVSPDDRALQFSNRLGGDRERLGGLDVQDPRIQDLANAYGVQLIDISGMSATDSLNHDRFIGATAALKTVLASTKTSRNPLRKAGAFVLGAVATVLETPGRIGRAAAEGAGY